MAAGLDDGGVEFVIIVVRVSMEEDLLGNLVMALMDSGVWTVETWVGNELVILLVLVDVGDVTADPCTSSVAG